MNDCKVCSHHYHESRTHCPTCGAFNLKFGSFIMKIDHMIRAVRAKGAYSVRQDVKYGRAPQVIHSHPW